MSRVRRFRGAQGQEVVVVAGITGLATDADVMREALASADVARVLLGVPFEDLDAIRATSGKEQETEFEAGSVDEAYLDRLKRYGLVRTPPPDLYVAYEHATRTGVPVEAVDLGDEAYTEFYTKNVGFLEVLRSNRQQRRILEASFDEPSADEFVRDWDAMLNATKGLRRLQEAREESMAGHIGRLAKGGVTVALVPLPRAEGIARRLVAAGWVETSG